MFAFATLTFGTLLLLLWWFDPRQLALPLCGFHTMTGLHCPGCGITRATHELLHGRCFAALHQNALWVLALPLIVYAVMSEVRYLVWGWPLLGNPARRPWLLVGFGVAAFVFAVARNVPWYPLNLLAPLG